nr:hypothetical protein [Tanacetum cinerariifolium]
AVVDIVVADVGTADNTDHTTAEHNEVGCRLSVMGRCKSLPCAQTLPGTCLGDMTAYTLSALSHLGVSPSYPSYHTSPA